MIPHLPHFIFRDLHEGCYKFVQWGEIQELKVTPEVYEGASNESRMMEHKATEYAGKVPRKFRGKIFLWRWFLGHYYPLDLHRTFQPTSKLPKFGGSGHRH